MRRTLRSKWWLVGAYWVAQATAVYVLTPLPQLSQQGLNWSGYVEVLADWDWILWATVMAVVLTGVQLVFLWPVRRPAPMNKRGWSLWLSLTTAGLAVAVLSAGFVVAVSYTLNLFVKVEGRGAVDYAANKLGIDGPWTLLAWCLVNWAVATPLLIRFCRRGPRETLLARLSARLFVGTVIEVAAIIPLDVMVRKKDSCYCLAGTYFALLGCGAVGLFALGPAIFLPLLARRRRRWYDCRCDWCGYDMSGTPGAARCPECGTGWRA